MNYNLQIKIKTMFVIVMLFKDCLGMDKYVTCGSVTKLVNIQYDVRLHSHDVKYGSGSGQQSVTGTSVKEDHNSNWWIKGNTSNHCVRGVPIACGQQIRLEHVSTETNLHSHLFTSPLSNQQEVSTFGKGGLGDTGDNWQVVCAGELWIRDAPIRFKHVDTDMYLAATGREFGRPIHGQKEIVGTRSSGRACEWKTAEGVFVGAAERSLFEAHDQPSKPKHTEL